MSIENVLTLGVAAAILLAAASLRLIVLGTLRLFFRLSGKEAPWSQRAAGRPAPPQRDREERRPVLRPVLNALGPARTGLVYVLATMGTWIRAAGMVLGRAAATAYAAVRPSVASGTQTGVAAAARTIKSAAILTAATAQHLAQLAAQGVNRRVTAAAEERARNAPVEEPSEARIIVLDRDWDPLTDPLEDEPASQAR